MVLSRKKMWLLLNEDERKQAVAVGLELVIKQQKKTRLRIDARP